MKKKIVLMMLVSAMAASTITGCGKESKSDQIISEIEASGDTLSEQDKKEIKDAVAEMEELDKAEEKEAEVVEYKMYDKASDWNDSSISYGAIQIDDIYYEPLMNLGSLMDKVAKSDANYEYEYNPESLLGNNEKCEIKLTREGNDWLTIVAQNISGDSCSVKDAVLVNVSARDTTYQYSYTLGGVGFDELEGMSNDDVTALAEKSYPDSNIFDKAYSDNITKNISFNVVRYDTYKDGKAYVYSVSYSVIVDKETNKVRGITYNSANIHTEPVQTEDIKDITVLSEDDKEAVKNACLENVKNNESGLQSAEILGDYHDSSSSGHPAIGYIVVAKYEDGTVKYINQRMVVTRDAMGNVQCSGDYIPFDDENQAIKMIDLK